VVLTTELPGRTSPYRIAEIRPQVNGLILGSGVNYTISHENACKLGVPAAVFCSSCSFLVERASVFQRIQLMDER
jgi:hypothetical protein